ncbi:MAG: ATP-dependent RecD-like DNA helicase [Coprobacillaceae bacterium]
MVEYIGYVRNVRFYSEETNYIVALIEVEQEPKPFVMNGYMNTVNDYDKYIFKGDYEIHPKYGKQFKLESYEVVLADDKDEIIKYLSSPLFKGIGQKQAEQIVAHLGNSCLEKIKEDKHVLDSVRGMNETKRETIYTVLTNNDFDQEVMQFFMGHGISLRNLGLIQAVYQEKTLEVLQNNPYQMIEDIDGIGFKTADELALKIGGSLTDSNRLKAAILFSIKQGCFSSGSSYLSLEEIVRMFKRQVSFIEEDVFHEYMQELIDDEKIIQVDDKYYYEEMHRAEATIASFISKLLGQPEEGYDEEEVTKEINHIEESRNINYASKQKEAIDYFLRYPCMILTGGPGTGKTTVVKALLQIYKHLYPEDKIALVAPTGRAAKRLNELTNMPTSTIHRLLKWDLHTNTFAMNKNNPLEEEILIIDEFSMVDSVLLCRLFEAGKKIRKILFIGDHHQLPSVAPGKVLKDLMETDIKTIELDEIFRQVEDSGIIQLAHQIIQNQIEDMSIFEQYQDINFFACPNYDIVKNVRTIVSKAINEGYDSNDVQVLAPMYQGVAGIDALNDALQEIFNPHDDFKQEIRIGNKIYREGDKILQLKNRPEDEVFNGDIGILLEVNKKDNFEYLQDTLVVDFDGIIVEYTHKTFPTITHAYCMSIHKSQGNEFKIVILSVLYDYRIMLRRNLIYTGLTRAKQ